MKLAAVGDIHIGINSGGKFTKLFDDVSQEADILLLCGDLTQHGKASEAEILAKELATCKIPVVGVLGNHDYEGNETTEINEILKQARVTMLDGEGFVYKDVGFAGVKGFGGGFDNLILTSWGEPAIKAFVNEAVNESLKLEQALNELETEKKIVLMHYSPIKATVVGEPEVIFPFLGSSRHADTINRLGATVVFHGHAHHGTHEGKTSKDIPVFNVSCAIMERINPAKPYMIYHL
jgi:Icc-related predicted phosphoesterase